MVLLTDCIACRHGRHERHVEVVQAVPKGVMGGARCSCTGDCAERKARRQASRTRPCPLCEGKGCSECDQTGKRVRTNLDGGGGISLSVSGSAELAPETRAALVALARAVAEDMKAEQSDASNETNPGGE